MGININKLEQEASYPSQPVPEGNRDLEIRLNFFKICNEANRYGEKRGQNFRWYNRIIRSTAVRGSDGGQGSAVERNITIRGPDGRKGDKNGPERAAVAVTSFRSFGHKESQTGKNVIQQASVY